MGAAGLQVVVATDLWKRALGFAGDSRIPEKVCAVGLERVEEVAGRRRFSKCTVDDLPGGEVIEKRDKRNREKLTRFARVVCFTM